MTKESRMNKQLVDGQEAFDRLIPGYTRQVLKALDIARIGVSDVLVKHAKNGKVPASRVNVIIRELNAVETQLYRDLLSQTTIVIEDAAETAGNNVNTALIGAVGLAALIALKGEEQGVMAEIPGFLFAIGASLSAFVASVASTVMNRKGDDGKSLRDRLRILAADIIADVKRTLRQNLRNSEDFDAIERNVLESFGDKNWRVKRIVESESPTAYRTAVAKAAEQSELVAALKIVDFPHGAPGEHEKHKCHIYAHRDEHGMGEGVYPVNTRKIRNPHPQCRSRLILVMREGVLDAK